MIPHITQSILKPTLLNDNTLHIVGVISNPVRYHSRYRIAREWIEHMRSTPNVHLQLVEAAFGDRQHEVTETNGDDLQLRTYQEAWIKEGLINIGMRKVIGENPNCKYLGWIDADVFFENKENWAQEAMHQMQHFEIIQPWSDALDLGHQGTVFQHFKSFGYQHQRGVPKQTHPEQKYYQYAHSGFAWCCTRKFWENARGLMDFAVLGSADHHMAFAAISRVQDTIHKCVTPSFRRRCFEWQSRVVPITNNEVGFVPGFIKHQFHGPKGKRGYRSRWSLQCDYDPDKQLRYDAQGIPIIVGNKKLEFAIHRYNLSRFEDSIEEN